MNITDLNRPSKIQEIAVVDQKTICCLQETHFKYKETWIKSEWMEKSIILTLNKMSSFINLRQNIFIAVQVIRDEEVHYIMIKGSILQET